VSRIDRPHAGHDRSAQTGLLAAHRLPMARSALATNPVADTQPDFGDYELDGPPPKFVPREHPLIALLTVVGRLAFSLFIAAGFAAGLGLKNNVVLTGPNTVRACGFFFCWVLLLITCLTGRRVSDAAPSLSERKR
jgi:hypothetical protein